MVRGFAALVGVALLCAPLVGNWVQAQGVANVTAVADREAAALYGAQGTPTCIAGNWKNSQPVCPITQGDTCTPAPAPLCNGLCPWNCTRLVNIVGVSTDFPANFYERTGLPCTFVTNIGTCQVNSANPPSCFCGSPFVRTFLCQNNTYDTIAFCN